MAGHAHTLVSTVSGNVWVFGCGLFGQLGNGSNKKSTVPLKVDFSLAIDGRGVGDVIDLVACGYFHNYALSAGIHLFQLLNMFFGSSVKRVFVDRITRTMIYPSNFFFITLRVIPILT